MHTGFRGVLICHLEILHLFSLLFLLRYKVGIKVRISEAVDSVSLQNCLPLTVAKGLSDTKFE